MLSRAKQRDSFSSLFSKGGLPGQIIGRQHDGRQTHQVHLDGAKVETLGFPPSCTTSNRTLPNTRNAELFSALALRNLTTTGLKGCNSKVAPFRHADEALLKASYNEFAAAETYPQRFGVCIIFWRSSPLYRICLRSPSRLVHNSSHDSSSLRQVSDTRRPKAPTKHLPTTHQSM